MSGIAGHTFGFTDRFPVHDHRNVAVEALQAFEGTFINVWDSLVIRPTVAVHTDFVNGTTDPNTVEVAGLVLSSAQNNTASVVDAANTSLHLGASLAGPRIAVTAAGVNFTFAGDNNALMSLKDDEITLHKSVTIDPTLPLSIDQIKPSTDLALDCNGVRVLDGLTTVNLAPILPRTSLSISASTAENTTNSLVVNSAGVTVPVATLGQVNGLTESDGYARVEFVINDVVGAALEWSQHADSRIVFPDTRALHIAAQDASSESAVPVPVVSVDPTTPNTPTVTVTGDARTTGTLHADGQQLFVGGAGNTHLDIHLVHSTDATATCGARLRRVAHAGETFEEWVGVREGAPATALKLADVEVHMQDPDSGFVAVDAWAHDGMLLRRKDHLTLQTSTLAQFRWDEDSSRNRMEMGVVGEIEAAHLLGTGSRLADTNVLGLNDSLYVARPRDDVTEEATVTTVAVEVNGHVLELFMDPDGPGTARLLTVSASALTGASGQTLRFDGLLPASDDDIAIDLNGLTITRQDDTESAGAILVDLQDAQRMLTVRGAATFDALDATFHGDVAVAGTNKVLRTASVQALTSTGTVQVQGLEFPGDNARQVRSGSVEMRLTVHDALANEDLHFVHMGQETLHLGFGDRTAPTNAEEIVLTAGSVRVTGNLIVEGVSTTVESSNLAIADKIIEVGILDDPDDATELVLDQCGIQVTGNADVSTKSWTYRMEAAGGNDPDHRLGRWHASHGVAVGGTADPGTSPAPAAGTPNDRRSTLFVDNIEPYTDRGFVAMPVPLQGPTQSSLTIAFNKIEIPTLSSGAEDGSVKFTYMFQNNALYGTPLAAAIVVAPHACYVETMTLVCGTSAPDGSYDTDVLLDWQVQRVNFGAAQDPDAPEQLPIANLTPIASGLGRAPSRTHSSVGQTITVVDAGGAPGHTVDGFGMSVFTVDVDDEIAADPGEDRTVLAAGDMVLFSVRARSDGNASVSVNGFATLRRTFQSVA